LTVDKAMPLTHVNQLGVETSQGVHFPMMDGYRSVRVHVTLDALLGKEKPSGELLGPVRGQQTYFRIHSQRKIQAGSIDSEKHNHS
jgi:hypothetical protein